MSKEIIIRSGLTGAEKKLAKNFGGVVVNKLENGQWHARFRSSDVYTPSYGGSIIMEFCYASGHTALRAGKELMRLATFNAENGNIFYFGPKSSIENTERSLMEADLVDRGFEALRFPTKRR